MNLLLYSSLSGGVAALCLASGIKSGQINNISTGTMLMFMLQSRFRILVMINLGYVSLVLFGKFLQMIFFGKLREVEAKNIYDRMLHYVLFKILFLGAIVEPSLDLLLFTAIFSVLGFLKMLSLLTRDRFEYITTFNPNTRNSVHFKLIFLLIGIILVDVGVLFSSVNYLFEIHPEEGYSRLLLIFFECFTLFLDSLQTVVKYAIHLIDIYIHHDSIWDERGVLIYYTEFTTDTLILVATMSHYIHILVWHGLENVGIIDFILLLHLRAVFVNLRDKIFSYRNYRKLAQNMKTQYPDVSGEELSVHDDVCAICHDKMTTAKKLPCGHFFHHSCLRSWLEQHNNCPTCRYSLILNQPSSVASNRTNRTANELVNGHDFPFNNFHNRMDRAPMVHQADGGIGIGTFNQHPFPFPPPAEHVYNFEGRRWFRWLPNVQFQVISHPTTAPNNWNRNPVDQLQLTAMASRVLEVFPEIPMQAIIEDLMITQSAELTIDNIIEGRFNNRHAQNSTPNATSPATSTSTNSSVVSPTSNVHSDTLPTNDSSLPNSSSFISNVNNSRNSPVVENLNSMELTGHSSSPISNTSSSPVAYKGEFANTSAERARNLRERKEQMLKNARMQYLSNSSLSSKPSESTTSSTSEEDADTRRKLLYESVQRRQKQESTSELDKKNN